MRLLLLIFTIFLINSNADNYKFSVTLKEQASENNEEDQKFLILNSDLTCGNKDCDYTVSIDNNNNWFWKVMVNNRECPNFQCVNSFTRNQVVNVTVHKIGTVEFLKIFDFEYVVDPNIVILGCEKGYYTKGQCSKMTSTGQSTVDGSSFFDEACVCSNNNQEYCDATTPMGHCVIGETKWWTTPGSSSPITSSTTPSGFNFQYVKDDITVTLQETDTIMATNNRIIVSAFLNCTLTVCQYKSTVNNNVPAYKVLVGDEECSGKTCSGTFLKGQSVPVLIKRLGQSLNLLTYYYPFTDAPNIAVLGCDYGLNLMSTCLTMNTDPYVNGKYLNDVFCSCQGTKMVCDDSDQQGVCIGGTPTFWTNDPDSTISTDTSIATTTFPPKNPKYFDLNFLLFEGDINGLHPENDHNVTIVLGMNCSIDACRYDVQVDDYAQTYYTVLVNGQECPGSHCSANFAKGDHVPVTVIHANERLELFDLEYFIQEPNVKILGCPYGLIEYGSCRRTQGSFDETVQKDDGLCVCQSHEVMSCDGNTQYGICSDGNPTWWQTLSTSTVSTSTVPSTTVPSYTNAFDISLFETIPKQDLSINGTLFCDATACQYDLTVTNSQENYFSVFVGIGASCPNSCSGSFQYFETVPVVVYKTGQVLNFFVLKFNEITVLNCNSGWLLPGKCIMAKQGNDQLCSCQGITGNCQDVLETTECASGNPIWWQPYPQLTTASSTVPSPTTTFQIGTSVSVTLTEASVAQPNQSYILTVEASMDCKADVCTYNANIGNDHPEFYIIMMDGKLCPGPCSGSLHAGDPSKILVVHRLGQHLNLIEFQFQDAPKLLVMGCENMIQDTVGIVEVQGATCLHIFQETFDGLDTFNDDVCLCNGLGQDCDDKTKIGKCSTGKIVWWQSDPITTVTTTPSTTTKTTTPATTTTKYDLRNQFSFDISLTEGRDKKKYELSISSEMKCTSEDCQYSIKVDNSAQAYFKVFVAGYPCQNTKCPGTFLRHGSVNVTVFRGNQVLDLFDFEYVDIPRIVVLGCEAGLAEYGTCLQMNKGVQVNNEEYLDQVCSCRSSQLDCRIPIPGICIRGAQNWWRNVDGSSTTVVSTVGSTSTPVPTTPSGMPSLQDLSNGGVDLNNVTQVLNDTHHYSSQGPNLNRTQIFDITKILHNSANLPGITKENAIQILQNMDQCLNAHRREIRNGQSKEFRLLNVLRPMVQNTKDKIIQYLHGTNMGFNAKKVDCKTENHTDDGMIYYGPDKGYAVLNDTNKLSATAENSIIVPLGSVCEDQEVSHVFFTIFRGQKLFTGPQKYRSYGEVQVEDDEEDLVDFKTRWKRDAEKSSTDTVSQVPAPTKCTRQISLPPCPVMSATLMAGDMIISSFKKAQQMSKDGKMEVRPATIAKLQFKTGNMPKPLHGSSIVTWFDTGSQEWSLNDQCKIETDENGLITASCKHLTDFTVLIYGNLDAEYVCSWPLIIVSYSVNGASIFCLLLLIVIGLMFYIRYDLVHRILSYLRGQAQTSGDIINLAYYCIFFMFFILSLFFMDQSTTIDNGGPTTTSTYCVVIAAMSYFSLISAIIMSMLIGIRMICHFFSPKLRAFFGVMTSPPAALSIGLVIPFTFTMVLALFDTQFFERNDSFCWVRPDYIVYAVVVPVVLPIVNGLICSTFAIYKMFFQAKRGLGNKETSHYDAEFWSKVVGLLIMQVAMGLPWGIEFILIGVSGPSPWNYIFVILLGTQGIDLFLIFLYRRQRLVNESRKWSAREEKLERKLRSRHTVVEEN